jgi:hypothetical protein
VLSFKAYDTSTAAADGSAAMLADLKALSPGALVCAIAKEDAQGKFTQELKDYLIFNFGALKISRLAFKGSYVLIAAKGAPTAVAEECSNRYAGFVTALANAGAAGCTACAKGSYSSAQATKCTFCAAGSFSSSPASPSCTACDAGTFSPIAGAAVCGSSASCIPQNVFIYQSVQVDATTPPMILLSEVTVLSPSGAVIRDTRASMSSTALNTVAATCVDGSVGWSKF